MKRSHWLKLSRSVVVTAPLLLLGCGDTGEADPPDLTEVAETYDASLNVDLSEMERSRSGLYTRDLAQGSGEPAEAGDRLVMHYTGWLPDGTQFDSSRDRDEPLQFQVGVGEVIEGWDEGVPGMRPGGRRQLVIPPALGYGAGGIGGAIPPAATLVFDVELLEVQ